MSTVTCPFCGHRQDDVQARKYRCGSCSRLFGTRAAQHQVALKHVAVDEKLLERVAQDFLCLDTNRQRWRKELPEGVKYDGLYVNDRHTNVVLIGRYVVRHTGR